MDPTPEQRAQITKWFSTEPSLQETLTVLTPFCELFEAYR